MATQSSRLANAFESLMRGVVWAGALACVALPLVYSPQLAAPPAPGWGQQNFELVSSIHRDPRMQLGVIWDREHNVLLQWSVAAGLLGLAAFLAIYLVAAVSQLRTALTGTSWAGPIFASMFVAHLTANAFFFDTPVTYVQSFLLFAFVATLARRPSATVVPKSRAARGDRGGPRRSVAPSAAVAAGICPAWRRSPRRLRSRPHR